MSVVEFIGFVVSLAAMIFLFTKGLWEQKQRREHPQEFAEKEKRKDQALKKLLNSLDIDEDDEEEDEEELSRRSQPAKVPSALRKSSPPIQTQLTKKPKGPSSDKFQFKSSLDSHHQESAIEKRTLKTAIRDPYRDRIEEEILSSEFRKGEISAYEIVDVKQQSVASKIIHDLPSLKDMLIIKEIFGPPKSMRINPWDE